MLGTGTGLAVLLVDDDPSFVRACARSWRSRCSVLAAHSREDALTIATANEVHLALVDHHLGGCTGLDLIPEIKAVQPEASGDTQNRPVVDT